MKGLPLSFWTAKEFRGRVEILPPGPAWKGKAFPASQPTKLVPTLFWRDPIECVQAIYHNPTFHGHIHLTPHRVYQDANRALRQFGEWISGDAAWKFQVRICLLSLQFDYESRSLCRRSSQRAPRASESFYHLTRPAFRG